MSDPNIFTFDGFVLRPAGVDDLELATLWVQDDPAHRGTPASFWIVQKMEIKSALLTDCHGPVFFFRVEAHFGPEAYLQVWIQFSPESTRALDERSQRGVVSGFAWLEKMFAPMGFQAVYFDTRNPKLVYFCRKNLGFVNTGRKNEQGCMVLKRRLMAEAA